MHNTSTDIRLQALDWLLAAAARWIYQDRDALPDYDAVSWKAVCDLAYFHNMEPLLYWMSQNQRLSHGIPGHVLQRWEQAYFENFLRNEHYYDTLREILKQCKQDGIPVTVLKGPALTGRVYMDTALRTLSDIDILCSPDDVKELVRISRAMGYELKISGDIPASMYHVVMQHAPSQTILEFHFKPYEVIRNHEQFMELARDRMEWIEVSGVCCPVLCLTLEFVFNVAHICQHRFDVSLKHYLDVAGLLLLYGEQLKRDRVETVLGTFGLKKTSDLTMDALSSLGLLPRERRNVGSAPPPQEFGFALRRVLALPDEAMLFNVSGFLWDFRIALENRKGYKKIVYVLVKTLFPFLGGVSVYREIRSSGDALRYYIRHLIFYAKRLVLTLAHLPRKKGSRSPARVRACAKDTITRRLHVTDRGNSS